MWWWTAGWWWWPGFVLMAAFMVICILIMVRMVGSMEGMCGFGRRRSPRDGAAAAERMVDDRPARGKIDITDSPSAPAAIAGIRRRAGGGDISAWDGPEHRDGRSNRDDTPLARSFRTR